MSDEPPKIRGGTKMKSSDASPADQGLEAQHPPPAPHGLPPPSPSANSDSPPAADSTPQGQDQPPAPVSGRSSGARSSSDLAEVKSLLKQATEEIRGYKAKIKELENEKARLKDSNAINAKRLAKMPTVSSANRQEQQQQVDQSQDESKLAGMPSVATNGTTTSALKQKLQDLSIENHLAVEKLAVQQRRIHELESTVDAQNKEMDRVRKQGGSSVGSGSRIYSMPGARKSLPAAGENSPPRRAGSRGAASGSPGKSSRSMGEAAVEVTSDPPTTRERLPPRGHHFDAMASVQITQQRSQRPISQPPPPSHGHHHHGSSASDSGAGGQYDEMMMNRFRRSLAPPPKADEMGEVVHGIVKQLALEMKRHGTLLPLTKVKPCVYKHPTSHHYAKPFPGTKTSNAASEATCFKKIHLTVDSGRLVVKGGGGHTDFMEYLERNRIAVPIQ